jgi:hypothetical protein
MTPNSTKRRQSAPTGTIDFGRVLLLFFPNETNGPRRQFQSELQSEIPAISKHFKPIQTKTLIVSKSPVGPSTLDPSQVKSGEVTAVA